MASIAALVVALLAVPAGFAAAKRPNVIGGGAAKRGTWPSVVRVLLSGEGKGTITCTGTVVAPRVVLTAGHCAGDPYTQPATPDLPSQLQVVVGSISATSGGTVMSVSGLVLAPNFRVVAVDNGTGGETDNDAALLQLTAPTTVPVMQLASSSAVAPYATGTSVSLAGWGVTASGSSTPAETLQTASMAIAGESQCAKLALVSADVSLDTFDQFCTTSQTASVSICNGDSGGPLVATSPNGSTVEIGLAVWTSSASCNPAGVDYYTRISALARWISSETSTLDPSWADRPGTASGSKSANSRRAPLPGSYRARTGPGGSLVITVAKDRTQISFMSATGRLSCSHGSGTLAYTDVLRGARYWPRRIATEKGLRFVSSLIDARGRRVSVTATFTKTGQARGTLTVSGRNSLHDACKSGPIHWSAALRT